MNKQTGITIADVIKMDCMRQSYLIAGAKGIKNIVTKVNIMADPDILNWVSPGEFLIMTSYSFKIEDIEWQKDFIRECARRELSGIGIKIYPNLGNLADPVIELADELNVPVISLCSSVPFSDILTSILKEIFNRQADFLQNIENIHQKIMDLMVTEASIDEVVNVVNENINNPVLVRLEFPEKIIMNLNAVDDEMKSALLSNVERYVIPSFNKRNGEKIIVSKELINGKYIKRMIKPIVVKENVYGTIFTWAACQPFEEFDSSVIEASASAISIEVLKKLSVREVESRYKQEFLDDLLSREEIRRLKALERSVFFSLPLEEKNVIVVINTRNVNKGLKKQQDVHIKQIQTRIIQLIEKLIDDFKLAGLAASKIDNIQILLTFKNNQKTDNILQEFCNSIDKNILQKFDFADFRIGVGRFCDGLKASYKSFMDAVDAINTGDILNQGRIIFFQDLGIYKILCQKSLHEELEKFYSYAIEALVEYDKRKSTELIKTLEAYFEYNGNLKKMADMLFTHYNTISYRINRIEEITGISLENSNDRLSIEIALKIKQFLKK